MKTLRQTCAVLILCLTLAGSALAGHMDTTGAPAPAPEPPPTQTVSATSTVTAIVVTMLSLIR